MEGRAIPCQIARHLSAERIVSGLVHPLYQLVSQTVVSFASGASDQEIAIFLPKDGSDWGCGSEKNGRRTNLSCFMDAPTKSLNWIKRSTTL
jgi:hypothetical protein